MKLVAAFTLKGKWGKKISWNVISGSLHLLWNLFDTFFKKWLCRLLVFQWSKTHVSNAGALVQPRQGIRSPHAAIQDPGAAKEIINKYKMIGTVMCDKIAGTSHTLSVCETSDALMSFVGCTHVGFRFEIWIAYLFNMLMLKETAFMLSVASTLSFHCWGHGFNPWLENWRSWRLSDMARKRKKKVGGGRSPQDLLPTSCKLWKSRWKISAWLPSGPGLSPISLM